jgi:hypothetical protein
VTSSPTHTLPDAARKPRRLGLYVPWAIALILAAAWSLAWLWLAAETGRRIDAAANALRASGWQASWDARRVGGYPFRLDADFTGLRLTDPAGWSVALPTLKGEAYVFAPNRWVFAAPDGLTFTRPTAGALVVNARLLRASVNGWDRRPPSISFQGDDVTLTPAPGAKPFWLTSAKTVQFYTRPAPDDQGAVFLGIDNGAAEPSSWVGQISRGAPVGVVLDGVIFRAGAFTGRDWRGAATNWTRNGGGLDVRQFTLRAGDASLESRRGSLGVDASGALIGGMDAYLSEPGRLFAGMPAKRSQTETLKLTFRDGSTWYGPLRLAPAPHLF